MMTGNYYVIDLSKLDNLTLNYGKDYKKWGAATNDLDDFQDLYMINSVTHQVYYIDGILFDKEYYFSKPINVSLVTPINLEKNLRDFEVNVIESHNNIVNSNKISLNALITVTLPSKYIESSLKYAWSDIDNESQIDDVVFSDFTINNSRATLESKAIDNSYSDYYLWIKVFDTSGEEHVKKIKFSTVNGDVVN